MAAYSFAAEDATVTCVSDEAPSDAHPADSTFYCELAAGREHYGKQAALASSVTDCACVHVE